MLSVLARGFFNWILRPIGMVIVGQFGLAICRFLGFDPAVWLGGVLMNAPDEAMLDLVGWGIAAGFAVVFIGIWEVVKRLPARAELGAEPASILAGPNPSTLTPAQIRRDVNLHDAVWYIATGQWRSPYKDDDDGLDRLAGDINDVADALKKIRQAALDGDLKIWGKYTFSEVYEEIPQGYWVGYGFEFLEFFTKDNEHFHTEFQTPGAERFAGVAHDMMTSKNQVQALWPKADILA